jgi:signal transduction histidine kinase
VRFEKKMKRLNLVYVSLLAVWAMIIVWQIVEHDRVKESARVALINRAKDISNTLGLFIRSQRRFITQERLEPMLNELVKPGELNAIALLNASGDKVAAAGAPVDRPAGGGIRRGEVWGPQTVTLINLVDLGTNVTQEAQGISPTTTIVIPTRDLSGPSDTNRPPPGAPGRPPSGPPPTNAIEGAQSAPRTADHERDRDWGRPRGGDRGRTPFGRPPWMSEEDYRAVIEKQGVHGFVIVLSTLTMQANCQQDLWLRSIIGVFSTLSAIGLGLAWRNLAKSSELELRLVRASELNSRLKEMNLAAAGLAHETRNPLNIIRGLAHMISKIEDTPPEIRRKSREIIDETDRVTAQLNEFINYSRPREVRCTATALAPVIDEVVRALNSDIEEKKIKLQVKDNQLTVTADEQQLRQTLFNLMLNAIQAVDTHGEIQLLAGKDGSTEAFLEIRDNGSGVLPDHRKEIFKPYFTTRQEGTGLGLAVVQQIVLTHGWEIECLPNEPKGAIFRITHLKLASPS